MCFKKIIVIGLGTVFLTSAAIAKEELAVVGSWSALPLHKKFETPFWTSQLKELSGNDLTAVLTTHDQMGIKGSDVYRMLGDGVFDVGMTVADYAVADSPALEGLDVPLIANNATDAKKMVDAARPMVDDIFTKTFNAKVLGIVPYPPQVVFCNADINQLPDLKGKKIRASGRLTAKLLEALGAEGVTIGFGEVPGALQRGVIDCAVTGAGSGYSAGWWEVSKSLIPIPIGGWDPVVIAINRDKWNSLSKKQQEELSKSVDQGLVQPVWKDAQNALQNDIACLTGNGECSYGKSHKMKLVKVTQADLDHVKSVIQDKVLPEWAKRSGKENAKRWNESVGKAFGIQIAL